MVKWLVRALLTVLLAVPCGGTCGFSSVGSARDNAILVPLAVDVGDGVSDTDQGASAVEGASGGVEGSPSAGSGSYEHCSFTTSTVVLMGDGSHKPIGDVRVGDRVESFDPGTGHSTVETVTAVWPHMDQVVTLTLSDGTTVETTDAHPWWVESTRTYTRTDHLSAGDTVLTADGSTLTVAGVSEPHGTQLVTNLTITGPHTYYVSDTSILVHNCDGSETAKPGSPNILKGAKLKQVLADLGYSDEHELKEEYVGSGAVSKFDIYIDKDTQGIYLGTKDGSVFVSVT